jgi:predicted nucleotidyltransferase component of viral defense system
MISLSQIQTFFPEHLHAYKRFMLREYLQCKILELIFDSKYAFQLSFLGGTCLRIVYNNNRFSEDLDFDNFGLSQETFDRITAIIEKGLKKLGYSVQIQNITRGAYHCYIRFSDILYQEGLSGHSDEKILIQLDSEAHEFDYQPDKPILNKFDVFTLINATPPDVLLSMKFYALMNRKRNKGRDFFDIVSMLGWGHRPNYGYLKHKLGVETAPELKKMILNKCTTLDMQEMANDVKPFLFHPDDVKKILLFEPYLEQAL